MLWRERLNSLKAGLTGGLAATIAFLITTGMSQLISQNGSIWIPDWLHGGVLQLSSMSHWQDGAIALISGFLFGITYRYAIRSDANPQLKMGVVTAFGLVRGLAHIEHLWTENSIGSLIVLLSGSMVMFAIAQLVIDLSLRQGWLETVKQ